ncbi:MAG TPA: DUF4162 domain-containing protein, partial [Marmoricola sp.]|nr:DUF4162 domain-containing protein [Marmoricola sp.]
VIDKGRIIAEGTPLELKDRSGAARMVVTLSRHEDIPRAQPLLSGLVSEFHLDEDSRQFSAPADLSAINQLASLLAEHQIEVDDLGLKRPSLDDVFLHLTGHRAESTDESSEPTQGVTK